MPNAQPGKNSKAHRLTATYHFLVNACRDKTDLQDEG
jgi:hypothetical protein